VSLVLGILFDHFFYGKVPGLSFPVYVILVLAGFFVIVRSSKKRINREALWLLLPILFFSSMVFIRAGYLLTFLNIVATLLLLLVVVEISFDKRMKDFLVGDYIKIFFLPFKFLRPLFQTLSGLFPLFKTNEEQKRSSQVIKGILMTIPVLAVFLFLFSSADLVFRKYVSGLIGVDIEIETVFRTALILIATLIFIGAYAYSLQQKRNKITSPRDGKNNKVGHIESSILLGSVNVLFFAFILVQLAYLFGGENNISAQGFTYAEYARQGFFELIAVAVVSLLLLLTIEKYILKKETDHTPGFKGLSTALVVQVIIIIFSAFIRLMLYEEAYGFTVLRLYSHAFIVLLAVVFLLLLYKIYLDKRESAFAFRVFVSLVLFLAIMNFLNPDAFIARRNLERFAATGKLDAGYLGQLSSDAVPLTIDALDISKENMKRNLAHKLYWHARDLNSSYFSKWQSLNISRLKASKILDSRMKELKLYKDH
jgi:hypothetical protein